MRIFSIDPGNVETGWARVTIAGDDIIVVEEKAKSPNDDIYSALYRAKLSGIDTVVIERVASFGMAVGKTIFDTCIWIGRFTQMAINLGMNVEYVYRQEEKMAICHDMRAKDANIRQALIDRFALHDFKRGTGTKDNKDVFYQVSKDVWSAIAVAVTYYEREKERGA